MNYIESREFLEKAESLPVVDVRSPGEFKKGHIPGSVNIPLFSDDERISVGTLFKKQGKKASVRKGLGIVGPRMVEIIDAAEKICPDGKLLIHCWRGGMRSESMAWLIETAGLECEVLSGGYKAYRKHIRETILENREILVLGGLTGSGKTILLNTMKDRGEPVIDLEGLANHRGSAFGGIGLPVQPGTEQFENDLFNEVNKIKDSYFWVEDESHQIGKVFIPEPFFKQMLLSIVIFIDVPDDYRIDILVSEYAKQNPELLEEAINKLNKRLGDQASREAVEFLREKNYAETARILLSYYDKTYKYGLDNKSDKLVHHLDLTTVPKECYADTIIKRKNLLLGKSKQDEQ